MNNDALSIQWFPGHMAKTKRMIQSNLKLVDAVVEILDARIPDSSRNPDLQSIIDRKPRLVLLNKCDYADETATSVWVNYCKSQGIIALPVDCRSGKNLGRFLASAEVLLKDIIEKNRSKGMANKSLRLMVAGIPNVGKSSLINRLAGKNKAKAEDRPGVTLNKQWVKLSGGFELLDTPGVLWPKFDDKLVGERLAFTGAVKDDIIDTESLCCRLLTTLSVRYARNISSRYKIQTVKNEGGEDIPLDGYEMLLKIGESRGFLRTRGEIDTERAAITVLDEYRAGLLGRITLELPEQTD